MTDPRSSDARDVFLCHAHLDKTRYVYPVADELSRYGVSFWLDEAEIGVGDRIAEKVSAGLRNSRFVVVFVTENLLARTWPQIELDAALNREVSSKRPVILAILDVAPELFADSFPLLAGKLHLSWSEGPSAIARRIADRLEQNFVTSWQHHFDAKYEGRVWIRFLQFGDRHGQPHTCSLRWGPWSMNTTFNSDSPAICLITSKALDPDGAVPLFVHVDPPCVVSFGTGPAPCITSIDINHSWHRA